MRIYVLSIVLIIPTALFLVINTFILIHAHSSHGRVAPTNTANGISLVNNRDIRVTKRMIILLSLFLLGWSPVYILFTIQNSYSVWVEILKLLAEFSLLAEVVNLFLYNRKVSLYLKGKFLHYMNITQA